MVNIGKIMDEVDKKVMELERILSIGGYEIMYKNRAMENHHFL